MRLQQTLSRQNSYNTFFRIPHTNYTVCTAFTNKLSGEALKDQTIARFTLATKNPKEKGFKKVVFDLIGQNAFLNGEKFQVIWKQLTVLRQSGLINNQTVWMKVELA